MSCCCCMNDGNLMECPNCHECCCIDCLHECGSFIHCVNCKTGSYLIIDALKLSDEYKSIYVDGWMNEQVTHLEASMKPISIQAHDYTELMYDIPEGIIEEFMDLREIITLYHRCSIYDLKARYGNVLICDRLYGEWEPGPRASDCLCKIINEIMNEEWFMKDELTFHLYIDDDSDRELLLTLTDVMNESKYNLLKVMSMEILTELVKLRKRFNRNEAEKKLFEFMLKKDDLMKSVVMNDVKPVINCERCGGVVIEMNDHHYACNLCKTRYCDQCMHPLPHKDDGCLRSERLRWDLLQKTTHPCPVCGFRFEKMSGCDDMFCNKINKQHTSN